VMRMKRSIDAFAIDSSRGIWGITNSVAWHSTDNGKSWDSVGPPTNRGFATIAVTREGSIILTSYSGPLWKSTDNGASWDSLSISVPYFQPVVMVTPASSELLIGNSSAAGIIRSTDDGRSWSERNHAIPSSIRTVSAGGGRLLIDTRHEIQFSNDKGVSWQKHPGQTDGSAPAMGISDAGTFLLKESNYLDRSTDGGLTWSRHPGYVPFSYFASNGAGDLFGLGGTDSLFISSDDGISWTSVPFPTEHAGAYAAFEGRSAAYVSSYGNGIHRSLDNGATWTPILPGYVQALTVDRTGGLVVLSGYPLLRSEDRGATWQVLADTSINFNSLVTAPDGSILGSTVDSGIWRSRDRGESWESISDGLGDLNISRIAIDRMTGDIYAATEYAGLFRLVDGILFVAEESTTEEIHVRREGEQLLFGGTGEVTIYNLLGEAVARPASMRWNTVGVPAGIYLYRVRSGEREYSGKVIVGR
jgi:photosystem II stability/assembly factor-like uncharacterized protein